MSLANILLVPGMNSRINLFNNSIFAGTVAGAPGTPPTGWTNSSVTGSISDYDLAAESITFLGSTTRRTIQQAANMPVNSTQRFDVLVNLISGTPAVSAIAGPSSAVPVGGTLQYQVNGSNVAGASAVPAGENVVSYICTTTTDPWVMSMRIGIGVNANAIGEVELRQPQRVLGSVQKPYQRTA